MLTPTAPPVQPRAAATPRPPLPALAHLLVRLAWHRYLSLPPHERPGNPLLLLTVPEARQLARIQSGCRENGSPRV
ncbi:MAG TPA: hypothetical protein VFW33_02665 [Gemmataceae bacterium]|nr:hypothetical protein [Gemmataceae bacterium]